jgi:hypothetical protein
MQTLPIVGITQLEGGTQLKLILEFEVYIVMINGFNRLQFQV